MRIYQDGGWVIERDSGEVIRLTPNESSLLSEMMKREETWNELLCQIENDEAYDSKRDEIIAAKEEILDELMWSDEREPVLDDEEIYSAIEKCVNLEDDDE